MSTLLRYFSLLLGYDIELILNARSYWTFQSGSVSKIALKSKPQDVRTFDSRQLDATTNISDPFQLFGM